MSSQRVKNMDSWKQPRAGRCYQCVMLINGVPCGLTFTKAWNLTRHVREKHKGNQPRIASTFVFQSAPTRPDLDAPLLQPRLPLQQPTPKAVLGDELPPGQLRLPPLTGATAGQFTPLPGPSALFPNGEPTAHARDSPPHVGLGKEQLLGRARFCDVMPVYEAALSKKYPRQQRGIQWLSESGRDHMENYMTSLMASWGVDAAQSGTCVVWPRDWQAIEPEAVVNSLQFSNCPLIDSDRAMYKYDDHMTSMARAIAWFGDWPRTGIQLDNFLEVGPYQRNDGSHRCHNPLCINPAHITFEPAGYNLGRQECQRHASFLRTRGRDVPEKCHAHTPPCLMQHASLTMFEACSIQLFVYRQSRELSQVLPNRPPWHPYPTFECQLPLKFAPSSTTVYARYKALTAIGPQRPAIICQLCSRIKSFSRVAALWSHIWNKHTDHRDEDKVREVRRTAALWEAHVKTVRTNPTDPTMMKLAVIAQKDFSWRDVEKWFM